MDRSPISSAKCRIATIHPMFSVSIRCRKCAKRPLWAARQTIGTSMTGWQKALEYGGGMRWTSFCASAHGLLSGRRPGASTPNQALEADGEELLVRFRSGGLLELASHLFLWAGDLLIEGPEALKDICVSGSPQPMTLCVHKCRRSGR